MRTERFAASIAWLALALVGCGRIDDRAPADPSTITVLYPIDERGLGPASDEFSDSLVFLPLVTLNERGEIEGRLARRWEHSPDYRTWTIHLRTDVRWHDGVPVTAHDVKFTLDLLAHPDVLREPAGAYSVTVLDDSTYTITYHRAMYGPLNYLGPVYYPKHLLEKLDPKEFLHWEFWLHPVGNGPYRYVRTVPATLIELEANPDYYRGKPKIERVVLKFGQPSLTALLSGEVDALTYLDRMDLLKLVGDPRFRVYEYTLPAQVTVMRWNQRYPPLRDPKVRRALTLAIDRRELHRAVNLPDGIPIFDVIFTDRQFRRGELPAPLPYDPEQAARLLDKAGWRDTDGDGTRDRDGKPFRFTALVPTQAWTAGTSREGAAVFVQAQLRRVGIHMEIQTMELAAARQRLRAGQYEAAVVTTLGGERQHLRRFGEGSPVGLADPRGLELLKQAAATMDPDEMDRIFRELMPIFQAAMPITSLYPVLWTTVAHRSVHGLSTPYRADPVWHLEDLWIEEED